MSRQAKIMQTALTRLARASASPGIHERQRSRKAFLSPGSSDCESQLSLGEIDGGTRPSGASAAPKSTLASGGWSSASRLCQSGESQPEGTARRA